MKLEVSIGEALDKLSILEIKKENILDEDKLIEINKEIDEIKPLLEEYTIHFWYQKLKEINKIIWDEMDLLRTTTELTPEWSKVCKSCLDNNDRRFRIKNKLNNFFTSELKEQKGYAKKKLYLLPHLGLGDEINSIGMVRYFSTIYDEVNLFVKPELVSNVISFYVDDPSIKLIPITHLQATNSAFVEEISKDGKLLKCGQYKPGRHSCNILPYNFYKDVDIEPKILWNYFYFPEYKMAKERYDNFISELGKISDNLEYVFTMTTSSEVNEVLNTNNFLQRLNGTNKNEIFLLNSNKNEYEPGHKFYNLAESMKNFHIIEYKDLMINAKYLYVSDSCFACLAFNLPLKGKFYLKSRGRSYYSYFYNPEFYEEKYNRVKFTQI